MSKGGAFPRTNRKHLYASGILFQVCCILHTTFFLHSIKSQLDVLIQQCHQFPNQFPDPDQAWQYVSEMDGDRWHSAMPQNFLFILFQLSWDARGWCSATSDMSKGEIPKLGGNTRYYSLSVLVGEML